MPSALDFPPLPVVGYLFPTVNPKWEHMGNNVWRAIAGTAGGSYTPVTERAAVVTGTMDFLVIDNDAGGTPKLVSASALAASVGGTIVATSPAPLTAGQWTAEATLVPGEMGININTLPSDGGSALTAAQYRVNGGAAITLVGLGTGLRVVTAGFAAGVAADIEVRFINAVSANPANWSPVKTRTPLASGGGGGDLNFVKSATARQGEFGNSLSQTFASSMVEGNHVLAVFAMSLGSVASGAGATLDGTATRTASKLQGLRTPSVGAAAGAVAAYSLAPSDNWGGVAIEVSGSAPVFDAVFSQEEAVGSGATRTLNITVAQDNSIVLFIASGDNDRTLTHVGGLTSLSAGISYQPVAWGKFDAGVHALEFTPSSSANYYGYAAFVWSPGP